MCGWGWGGNGGGWAARVVETNVTGKPIHLLGARGAAWSALKS